MIEYIQSILLIISAILIIISAIGLISLQNNTKNVVYARIQCNSQCLLEKRR